MLILSLVIALIVQPVLSYLQFTLHRQNPLQSTLKYKTQEITDRCLSGRISPQLNSQNFFDQLCYFKDIAYSIELFYQDRLYNIAIDLTSPYSWLKGKDCHVVRLNHNKQQNKGQCHLLSEMSRKERKLEDESPHNLLQEFKGSKKRGDIQSQGGKQGHRISPNARLLAKPDLKGSLAQTQLFQESITNSLAKIQGSNQIVEGHLQRQKAIQFWTRDNSRLSRLADLFLLGLYVLQQKEKIPLLNTNFITASKLSANINRLMDGALSLRFDQGAQNSFLEQIFKYVQSEEQIVTLYINEHSQQSVMTIGELSVKNSAEGLGGIKWIQMGNGDLDAIEGKLKQEQVSKYGALPRIDKILLESIKNDRQYQVESSVEEGSSYSSAITSAVFSLSATYIGFPQRTLHLLINQFLKIHNWSCSISKHSFMQCQKLNGKKLSVQQLQEQSLLFALGDANNGHNQIVSIPLDSLALNITGKKWKFNLRMVSKSEKSDMVHTVVAGKEKTQDESRFLLQKEAMQEPQSISSDSNGAKPLTGKQSSQPIFSYVVFGEPYFKKYFTLFDYKRTRVGFAPKRVAAQNTFVSVIGLIRFTTTLFVIGCMLLLCFKPLQAMFIALRGATADRKFFSTSRKGIQGRRLISATSHQQDSIQENAYQEV